MFNVKHAAALSALMTLAVAAPATAQESPFSGVYIGANAGWVWGDTKAGVDVTAGSGSVVIPPQDVAAIRNAAAGIDENDNGFAGGGQIGYNWTNGGLMLGVESDFTFTNISKSNSLTVRSPLLIAPPIDYTLNRKVESDWIWTVRPRIGYVAGQWMFFGSAGVAMTELKYKADLRDNRVPANVIQADISDTKTGWAAGLGAAYAMDEHWSVSGEWLYANFGKVHETVTTPNGFVNLESEGEVDASLLRVGVNYRF